MTVQNALEEMKGRALPLHFSKVFVRTHKATGSKQFS